MANYEYLNKTGLSTLWEKIKGRVVIVSKDDDLTTSRKASVGTIVVSKENAGTSTGGGNAVIVTSIDSSGNANGFSYLNGSDLIALNAAITECSTSIADVKSSVGAIGNLNIAKATQALTAGGILVGNGAAEIKPSGYAIGTLINSTATATVPTSATVAAYVDGQITASQQSEVKTYAIAVEGTFLAIAINQSLDSDESNLSLSYDSTSILVTTNAGNVSVSKLKVGDVVYITKTNVPDRWVSANDGSNVTFSALETQDLSGFLRQPSSTLTGNTNQTITQVAVGSDNELTATWSNIVLGNIDSSGSLTGSAGAIANTSTIVIAQNGKITKSGLTFNTGSTYSNYFLSQNGKFTKVDMDEAVKKADFKSAGQLVYGTGSGTYAMLNGSTAASGTPILSYSGTAPTWDTITPITDDYINNLN